MTGSFNLIGIGGSGGLTNGVNHNQVGVTNPGLASGLANNGGPTQTIALLAGSPASQAGSASISGVTVPTTDQRGALRNPEHLNDGTTVDVGAYESSSTYLVTTPVDSFGVGTLRSAIAWANSNASNPLNPVTNIIVFSDTTFSAATPQTITLSPALGTIDLTNTSSPTMIDGPGYFVQNGVMSPDNHHQRRRARRPVRGQQRRDGHFLGLNIYPRYGHTRVVHSTARASCRCWTRVFWTMGPASMAVPSITILAR